MAVESRRHLPKRLVGVSFKMYFDLPETIAYLTALSTAYRNPHQSCGIFVLPSSPAIYTAATILSANRNVWLGAQSCHWEDSGAYTGEVSPLMLKQLDCKIVEMGHAERRQPPFNEHGDITSKKAKAAVRNGLIPLICIGENSQSKIISEGVGLAIWECDMQITAVLDVVPQDADLIFVYEPVWAIGALGPATADHVLAVVGELRKRIIGRGRSGEVRILYGGSAKPGTWETLKNGVDGLFLGRFVHDVEAFKQVVKEVGKE